MTDKNTPSRADHPRSPKVKRRRRPAPVVRRWQFSDWAISCGTELLSTGPMSWSIDPIELRALRRCRDRLGDGEMLLREYSERVFDLARDAFYVALEDLEWRYEFLSPDSDNTILHKMESDCVRLWNGGDIDRLCVLPLSWGWVGMYERFIRFDTTVEQVNKALTHVLFRKLSANRHILTEALFDLEVEQLGSTAIDCPSPSAYQ